ncbi:MAG: hypothetical protein QGG40_20270, partial [Myxococcota bacterium]|nr:hypothetical protein [Myxococcota bacterium]
AVVAIYVFVAMILTWPAVVELGQVVPGAGRTDLWNSLWSIWLVHGGLSEGAWITEPALLNCPSGGGLLVSDPLGALLAAPMVSMFGLTVAYCLLVWMQLALAGVLAHGFAHQLSLAVANPAGSDEAPGASPWSFRSVGWVAGLSYAAAPVLLSGVHNGTSEAFAGGWAAGAAWACWSVARRPSLARGVVAVMALFLASLASWYSAVVAFLFAGALLLVGTPGAWKRSVVARTLVIVVAVGCVAPLAAQFHSAAREPGNLVGIKQDREVRMVRRSTGAADPRGYLVGGDFRSPDFRLISRYGEEFVHCHYLGWVGLLLALVGLRDRRRGTGFIWLAGAMGGVLSLGPVWVQDAMAVIVLEDRAVPLPYFLLESLPGFGSLSLVYRLAQAPALAVSLLAAVALGGRRGRWTGLALAGILIEGHLVSPMSSLPDTSSTEVEQPILALAQAPDGAVMNFPVVG